MRHPALHRREVWQQRPDSNQDPDVGTLIRSYLVFGHPVRLSFALPPQATE